MLGILPPPYYTLRAAVIRLQNGANRPIRNTQSLPARRRDAAAVQAAIADNVVVLFTGRGQRNGKRLHNPTALRIQIRAGAAVEFTEFVWDPGHVEDFWA